MTADELSTRALQLLNIYEASETPPDVDLARAFVSLNDWIGTLGTYRPVMLYILRTVQVLASGTSSYTVGAGGTINIQRPTFLPNDGAKLIIDNTAAAANITEIPLKVLTDEQWMAIPQKGLQTSLSSAIYYDHRWNAGLGTIFVFPIPNVATTSLVLYTPQALAEFADRNTTNYTFPPGYARCMTYNLACECAPLFQTEPSARTERIARESLADIQRANFRPSVAGMDAAWARNWRGSQYNIRTDGGV